MAKPAQWTCLSKLEEMVKDRGAWHAAVHGVTELDMTEQLNDENSMKTTCKISEAFLALDWGQIIRNL